MSCSTTGRILCWLLLCASGVARAQTVDASKYDAFWLWAGVQPQAAMRHAKTVYLLDAEVRPGWAGLIAQRPATPHVQRADVWIVIRVETLDWSAAQYAAVLADVERWRAAGNRVVGLQVDFDAKTHHLDSYALFLQGLRARLPPKYKLGTTGLLDWSAHGDPAGLAALAGVVDEVVLQIYQGRHVIPGYQSYLERLDRLRIPFRIGLLEGGEWNEPADLKANAYFRGFVVFLENPVAPRSRDAWWNRRDTP